MVNRLQMAHKFVIDCDLEVRNYDLEVRGTFLKYNLHMNFLLQLVDIIRG